MSAVPVTRRRLRNCSRALFDRALADIYDVTISSWFAPLAGCSPGMARGGIGHCPRGQWYDVLLENRLRCGRLVSNFELRGPAVHSRTRACTSSLSLGREIPNATRSYTDWGRGLINGQQSQPIGRSSKRYSYLTRSLLNQGHRLLQEGGGAFVARS